MLLKIFLWASIDTIVEIPKFQINIHRCSIDTSKEIFIKLNNTGKSIVTMYINVENNLVRLQNSNEYLPMSL